MAAWLGLEHDEGGWAITDNDAMRRVINGMDCPANQHPSIAFFVGHTAKAQALRSLYPHNNAGRHRKQGWAQLHLSGAATSHPVIVIESSLSRTSPPGPSQQEPLRRYPIPRTRGSSYEDLRSLLYRDVLLPIVDTVCVFAADCGGIRHVQHLLASWGPLPPTGLDGAAAPMRPRSVIVLTDPNDDAVPAGGVETMLQATAVPHLAGSVAVQPLDEVRTLRANANLLFRGQLRHVAQGPASPFNCVQACRPQHLDADEVAQYLRIFLQLAEIADPSIATFIAPVFLMDAYPPGMHSE
ncbi:hypothetical protein BDV35DRAFT_402969 [Aspergillus flavus]|uniref:Uncharacterized protein n=1 Tax=Aspergillus flavus TaxID=5059 RepID=A0A5N6GDF0_ASPFL|nr:hypothetical protein BDV35DRAFT_402969 [Aspergillus flavus]